MATARSSRMITASGESGRTAQGEATILNVIARSSTGSPHSRGMPDSATVAATTPIEGGQRLADRRV